MAHELTHVANRDVMIMTLGELLRHDRRLHRAVRLLLRRRRSQSDDDDGPSFIVLLLVSLAVYVVSFVLMQALSRYREFAADRGAALITGRPSALASALVKISGGMDRIPQKDLRAVERAERVLHLPGRHGQGPRRACSRRTRRWRSGSPRLQRLESQLQGQPGYSVAFRRAWASSTSSAASAKLKQPAADRLFAMSTAYVKLEMELELTTTGEAAIVFQPLATSDFEGIVKDMEEVVQGHRRGDRHDGRLHRRRVRLPLDDPPRPRHRGPRGRRQRGLHRDPGRRLRRPRAVRRVRVQGRARQEALLHLQLQARRVLPVRARPAAPSSATTSASCGSRPRSAPTCRSRPSSSAGSRSGASRSRSPRCSSRRSPVATSG